MGTTWLVFHHGQNPGRTDLVARLRSHRPSHPLNPGLCCPLAGGVEVDQKAAQLSFFFSFLHEKTKKGSGQARGTLNPETVVSTEQPVSVWDLTASEEQCTTLFGETKLSNVRG